MSYARLVWAGMWRKRGRAILTFLSIVNAFLLFGLLQGFSSGVDHAIADTRADILVTYSRVSQAEPLPISHLQRIAGVKGVTAVTPAVAFPTSFGTPPRAVQAFAVDPDGFLSVYPTMGVTREQIAALKATRTGALVSGQTAAKFRWRVGQRVPLQSNIWSNKEGGRAWPVDIVGIYTPIGAGAGGNPVLLNYRYIDEGRALANGTSNFFFMKIASPSQGPRVAAEIDHLFTNSPYEVKTVTESQLSLDALRQIGDVHVVINGVVGALFFVLLFSVGAAISQVIRERVPEIAILKTLGFSDAAVLRLVAAEILLFCVMGAIVGVSIALLLFPIVEAAVGLHMQGGAVMGLGLVFAVALALISGLPSALRAQRLQIVDALAGR